MEEQTKKDNSFNTLVINARSRVDRRESMISRLANAQINFKFSVAVEPRDLSNSDFVYLNEITTCVWKSHLQALQHAATTLQPTLILEDDAVLSIDYDGIKHLVSQMSRLNIDFLQVGFLRLNLLEGLAIGLRNAYDFLTRRSLMPRFFAFFGFKEVERAKNQAWRRDLPSKFILNDVRYGAHCYIVMPKFAEKIAKLNDPAFLSSDDFYVALSRMKNFKMIRLRKSLSCQDNSPSSFSKRSFLE